jgi:NitT/TauT family transport system substrate-binding protein
MKIRIGHLSTFYHTAILLMANGDTDSRVGAEIEWKLMGTGPAIMKAFGRGELDMAYIGLPPAIIGIDQGIKVTCVAGGHVEGTVLAGKAQWTGFPETEDLGIILRQFRGAESACPERVPSTTLSLHDCIQRIGLEQEVEINYPWADLVTEAVVKTTYLLPWAHPPWLSRSSVSPAVGCSIHRQGSGPITQATGLSWTPDIKTGNNDGREVSRTHEEATEFIRRRPADAARLIADYVGIVDEHFVLDTLMLSPKYCAQLTEGYLKSTMKFVTVLKKLGYIGSEIAQEKIFSPT